MFSEILYTIVHNNLRYVIHTDGLCDEKLWITVYDGDNRLGHEYLWLLNKNFDIVKTHWKDAARFDWSGIKWSKSNQYFSQEVKNKIDSHFKLKAFW